MGMWLTECLSVGRSKAEKGREFVGCVYMHACVREREEGDSLGVGASEKTCEIVTTACVILTGHVCVSGCQSGERHRRVLQTCHRTTQARPTDMPPNDIGTSYRHANERHRRVLHTNQSARRRSWGTAAQCRSTYGGGKDSKHDPGSD